MKISTNWLRDFIELAPPITRTADRLTMAGLEVKKCESLESVKDTVFEIEITSNRPDWLSHLGVAREISAVENLSLKLPALDAEAGRKPPHGWDVRIKDQKGCPYYTGVLIEGITETKTPEFIVQRLLACGVRSINLIVDITNYVLLEFGQPLHAFDADLLKDCEIQVRKAKSGEKIAMIDGSSLELREDDLVIADGERAVALAGVMGGKDSEISERTRNVFLESAFFDPARVRQAARVHQVATDSSYRFERRVDPEGVDLGRRRALELIIKHAKPRNVSAAIKAGEKPQLAIKAVHFRSEDVRDVLGCEVKPSQIVSSLSKLGLDVKQHAVGSWRVGIPSFRPDLTRPVDLVEEVARIYGFDNIPETLPERAPISVSENPRLLLERGLRRFLSGVGLHETVTFSLIPEDGLDPEKDLASAVKIVNPLHHGLHWMRPTIITGLLGVIQRNINAGAEGVPVFEIANVYSSPDPHKHPAEERTCAIALYGKRAQASWLDQSREVSFFDLKGLVDAALQKAGVKDWTEEDGEKSFLKPATTANLLSGKLNLGFLGEVSPEVLEKWDIKGPVFYGEISIDRLLERSEGVRRFQEWPRYPAVERDLSLTVKEDVKFNDLMAEVRGLGHGLIRDVRLFDLYKGKRVPEGFKNLAFRIVYQSLERTLVSDEVQQLHDKIASTLVQKYQASFQK
jgi:phenylalanyl-tRNA synthetase beta chain